MKTSLILVTALTCVLPAFASANTVIERCKAQFFMDEQTAQISIEISQGAKGLIAKSQMTDGPLLQQNAALETHRIREGLTGDALMDAPGAEIPQDLNRGESLIMHAMALESIPEMKASSGVDLKKVRGAKVYVIGLDEQGSNPIGMLALIEALDAKGASMGRFVGGFFVGKCQ